MRIWLLFQRRFNVLSVNLTAADLTQTRGNPMTMRDNPGQILKISPTIGQQGALKHGNPNPSARKQISDRHLENRVVSVSLLFYSHLAPTTAP